MLRKQDSNRLLKGIKAVLFATSLAATPISIGAEEMTNQTIVEKEITIINDEQLLELKYFGIGLFITAVAAIEYDKDLRRKLKSFDALEEDNITDKEKLFKMKKKSLTK